MTSFLCIILLRYLYYVFLCLLIFVPKSLLFFSFIPLVSFYASSSPSSFPVSCAA